MRPLQDGPAPEAGPPIQRRDYNWQEVQTIIERERSAQQMQSLQWRSTQLETQLEFERSRPAQAQPQEVRLNVTRSLPANELKPPEEYETPGIPDLDSLSESLGVFGRDGAQHKVRTCVPPIDIGQPLSGLSSKLENEDLLSGEMEDAARRVRSHMSRCMVSQGEEIERKKRKLTASYLLTDSAPTAKNTEVTQAPRSWNLTSPQESDPGDEGEAIGLPVTARAERILGQVAYGQEDHFAHNPALPHRAAAVRIPESDYQRCVNYNLGLSEQEYPVLVSGDNSLQKPEAILARKLREYAGGRLRGEADRIEHTLKANKSALKCSLAAQSAAESSRLALSQALHLLNQLRVRSEETDPLLYQEAGSIRDRVEVARSATFYADQAALASTEAAAQACRHGVLRHREMTVEAVFKAPPVPARNTKNANTGIQGRRFVPHRLVKATSRAPVVPSSLFGGRLFSGFSELGILSEGRSALDKIAAAVGAEVQTGSGSSKPFAKGRGRNNDRGGATAGTSKKRCKQRQQRKLRENREVKPPAPSQTMGGGAKGGGGRGQGGKPKPRSNKSKSKGRGKPPPKQ
jgi:hypothetical protein